MSASACLSLVSSKDFRDHHQERRAAHLRRSQDGSELAGGGQANTWRKAGHHHAGEGDWRWRAARGVRCKSWVMDLISQHKVFQGGTYNTNRVSMAAGLAMFREVLTPENYATVAKLNKKLADGYRKTIAKVGLQAYVASAGANGSLMLYPQEIHNYRDWLKVDQDLWGQYWFGMVNRGVLPQPYWWDEQWTVSVQHTDADIDKHLAAFEDIAPGLAKGTRGTWRRCCLDAAGHWQRDRTLRGKEVQRGHHDARRARGTRSGT